VLVQDGANKDILGLKKQLKMGQVYAVSKLLHQSPKALNDRTNKLKIK
jgi:hypothetical protein